MVGFKGSKVFCLQYISMTTVDIPQTASMIRYLEDKDFDNAYRYGWNLVGDGSRGARGPGTAGPCPVSLGC